MKYYIFMRGTRCEKLPSKQMSMKIFQKRVGNHFENNMNKTKTMKSNLTKMTIILVSTVKKP